MEDRSRRKRKKVKHWTPTVKMEGSALGGDDGDDIRTAAQANFSEVGLPACSSQCSYMIMTFCTELPLGQGSVKYLMSLKGLTPLESLSSWCNKQT
jgi:hypothetical protein